VNDADTYTPPRVWTKNTEYGGIFAPLNSPVSGTRHQQDLPRGRHALQLYSQGTMNGMKVTILLEELLAAGVQDADYDAWLIDIFKGDQFGSGFVELNPNAKIPALVDYGPPEPVRIFESGAILLYLAEKFDRFLPKDMPQRMKCLSWLFWQVGSAPYVGGGFGHFYVYAPIKLEYAIDRFTIEVKRQLDVLNRWLAGRPFVVGEDYTIADIAIFPWYGGLVLGWNYDAAEFLNVKEYPNVIRWSEKLASRPAVQRGRKVNKTQGDLFGALRERHDAADFDRPID
jgi:GSH-dependent disulfide-bond oxidoreductase